MYICELILTTNEWMTFWIKFSMIVQQRGAVCLYICYQKPILEIIETSRLNKKWALLSVGDYINLTIKHVEAWYSLEQYIGLKEDKLSSTTVDFIRSEGNLETTFSFNTFSTS